MHFPRFSSIRAEILARFPEVRVEILARFSRVRAVCSIRFKRRLQFRLRKRTREKGAKCAHTALQIHMTSDWVPMYSNVFKSAHFCETKAGPKEVFFGDEVVNECWKSGSTNSFFKA